MPAKPHESLLEKGTDVVRLQPPRRSTLHLLPDLYNSEWIKPFGGQLALPDQGLDLLLVDHTIHGGKKSLLVLGVIAIKYGFHQQLAQWLVLE